MLHVYKSSWHVASELNYSTTAFKSNTLTIDLMSPFSLCARIITSSLIIPVYLRNKEFIWKVHSVI